MLRCPGVTRGGGAGTPKMFTPPFHRPPEIVPGRPGRLGAPWGGGGVGARGTIGVLTGTPSRGQLLKERQPVQLLCFGAVPGQYGGYRNDGMGRTRVGGCCGDIGGVLYWGAGRYGVGKVVWGVL